MLEAYDTQLETIVSAEDAAINGDNDRYRYECAYCGEGVHIAAAGSNAKATHFRHFNENNNTDCEKYLGARGQRFYEKSTNCTNLEFYFDELQKCFLIGFSFSELALREHENLNSKLYISNTVERASDAIVDPKAFFECTISKTFTSGTQKKIVLQRFGRDYVIWNDLNRDPKILPCFKDKGFLTVFKVLSGSGDSITAKLVKGEKLFTGVRYLVLSYNKYNDARKFSVPLSIVSEREFAFSTMDMKFFARIVTITDTSDEANRWCGQVGYDLEQSEQFMILWPPVSMAEEVNISSSDEIIAFTSFKLKPHGNIKLRSQNIEQIDDNCYKLKLSDRVKVFNKNAEVAIEHKSYNMIASEFKQSDALESQVTVDASLRYFSFSCDGVAELPYGARYPLFAGRIVKGYRANYLLKRISAPMDKSENIADILEDIKKVYRVEESFVSSEFSDKEQSSTTEAVLDACTKSGRINLAVKRLIKGGIV